MFTNPSPRPKKPLPASDKIWLSQEQKLSGICQSVAAASRQTLCVVVTHFERSHQELAAALQEAGLPYESVATVFDQSLLRGQVLLPEAGKILLTLGGLLPQLPSAEKLGPAPARAPVHLLVGERHFLLRYDDLIQRWAATIPHPVTLEFHSSLEDPLFERFGGPAVARLLVTLKQPANEAVSSGPLTQVIGNMQAKIERHLGGEEQHVSFSPEQWLAANLPNWP